MTADNGSPAAADGALIGLLWGSPPAAKRGPKPKFTLDQVVDAGIAIADAHGLEAVTMQRVADLLQSTKMALYRYVPGKSELTALMLDRALGLPGSEVTRPGDWRRALAAWGQAVFERSLARPWALELSQRPHPPGPCELQWFEAGLAAMAGLPLTGTEKLDVLALLAGLAAALRRQAEQPGSPEAQLAANLALVLASRARDFPHTVAAFADSTDDGRDQALPFGIERILDGLAALIARRSAGNLPAGLRLCPAGYAGRPGPARLFGRLDSSDISMKSISFCRVYRRMGHTDAFS
jgi:AcrR family transcriptional regulator